MPRENALNLFAQLRNFPDWHLSRDYDEYVCEIWSSIHTAKMLASGVAPLMRDAISLALERLADAGAEDEAMGKDVPQ